MHIRTIASNLKTQAQALIRALLGSSIEEYRFRVRTRDDVEVGFTNVSLPHRQWLASFILADNPIAILEIGCGWGANLEVLARDRRATNLFGIDISPASIKAGLTRFRNLGVDSITLVEQSADDLSAFADQFFDVVFTDAALMYVGPDKIYQVTEEIIRVARRRVIVLELGIPEGGVKGIWSRDGWLRDYARLFQGHPRVQAVSSVAMPRALRTAGRWPSLGALTTVEVI